MQNILVTGGAGYIGSHACKVLSRAGYCPVTYDNLSTGWQDAVKFGPFEQGDLLDQRRLDEVFARYAPVAVMHFAALSQVGESMQQPGRYWRNNVLGTQTLIEAMLAAECNRLVFSSTCAIYGDQDGVVLDENSPQAPISPYAATKRAIEDMIAGFAASDGLRHATFRYFNVAGADPEAEVGEFHRPETHLIPLVLDTVMGRRAALTLHGTDYPTADGTCIRDYVHVVDLIEAHILGLKWLEEGGENRAFNLGTGHGFSVRAVLQQSEAVTGQSIQVREGPRRAGDCAVLVSGSKRAEEDLGWAPKRSTLSDMIADAWRWQQVGAYER